MDNSFHAPGIPAGSIGRRLDGWADRDLNLGAIVNLSPDLSAPAKLLGVDQATAVLIPPAYGLALSGYKKSDLVQ